ncbi:IL-6 subfamily cytokine M17 isoform 1-T1 [Menidia menidia]
MLYLFSEFIIMFLVAQMHPVLSAPTHMDCYVFEKSESVTALLLHEAIQTFEEYIAYYHFEGDPDELLDSTVAGVTPSEKQLDIYVKTMLFRLHIHRVKEDQEKLFKAPESILMPLKDIRHRLGHHLDLTKTILGLLEGEVELPPRPTPLALPYEHRYEKKVYGWKILASLKHWLARVLEVQSEAKAGCLEGI